MKKVIRNMTLSLLGTAMGMYMMAAPLSSTVYAADLNVNSINDSDWGQQRDSDHRYDRDGRYDRDNRYDREDQEHHFHRMRDFARNRMEVYRNWQSSNQIDASIDNPVDVVKAVADVLGFDVNNDTFTLIDQSDVQAIVQVVHNGNTYNITVEHPSNQTWTVTSMTPIQ